MDRGKGGATPKNTQGIKLTCKKGVANSTSQEAEKTGGSVACGDESKRMECGITQKRKGKKATRPDED